MRDQHKQLLVQQLELSNPNCEVHVSWDYVSQVWRCTVSDFTFVLDDWHDELDPFDEFKPWTPAEKVILFFREASKKIESPLWAEIENDYEFDLDNFYCYINSGSEDDFEVAGALICPANAESVDDVKIDIW